jgi:hypothetical protein
VSPAGALFARSASSVTAFATGLAWLWRLGPVLSEPHPAAVGIGALADAPRLSELVRANRLRGAVILAGTPGPAVGPVPARALRRGTAALPGGSVRGDFVVFGQDAAVVRSSLGTHAVRDGALLMLGADTASWGRLELAWTLDTIARFLTEVLDRPLVLLPPVGCLRWDDVPGTAHEQLEGTAHGDRRQRARVARALRVCRRRGVSVNLAVPVSALAGGRETEIDAVWPSTVAKVAQGVASGAFEVVCHGTLHFDTAARAQGALDPREFAALDADEAGRRLDKAMGWLGAHVGPPGSFIAPAWGYSPGTLAAARERNLPTWHRPMAGPLLDHGDAVHETVDTGLPGLAGLDYRPLAQLARVGMPPVLVIHGTLLDYRLMNLRLPGDAMVMARLALRRDLPRLLSLPGVRWISSSELIDRLRRHARIEVDHDRPLLAPEIDALLWGAGGPPSAR